MRHTPEQITNLRAVRDHLASRTVDMGDDELTEMLATVYPSPPEEHSRFTQDN